MNDKFRKIEWALNFGTAFTGITLAFIAVNILKNEKNILFRKLELENTLQGIQKRNRFLS
tara:strand:+ start:812 stop:991 length:180 start_codon:yes stop_codon:yes gene_type:complete